MYLTVKKEEAIDTVEEARSKKKKQLKNPENANTNPLHSLAV
jgi:hypothetical protein